MSDKIAAPRPIVSPAQAERMREALRRFGEVYGRHIRERVVPALKRFDGAVWTVYRQAGAPYGDTAEGRLRWVQEQGERQRERDLAEREAALRLPLTRPRRRTT